MDVFKLKLSDKYFYKLDKDIFEELTQKRKPWYQTDEDTESYFAICPSCNNTTQIIGFNSSPGEDKPLYAKHYLKKPKDSLGILDRDAYEWCPRASNNKSLAKSSLRPEGNLSATIKKTLIAEFDRVIYLLNKQLPIVLTTKPITEMLEYYKSQKGWLYRGSTIDNIPWTFAYMTKACSMFGRFVPDKDLRDRLCSRYSSIYFDDNNLLCKKSGSKEFFDASFCFIHHKRHLDGHKLDEQITFSISDGNQQSIYKKVIKFDHQYFCNLLSKNNENNRNNHYLELCRSILN